MSNLTDKPLSEVCPTCDTVGNCPDCNPVPGPSQHDKPLPDPWLGCSHPDVKFDEEAARGLSAEEVRRRWPRGSYCPHCGFTGIIYASYAHYISGDW